MAYYADYPGLFGGGEDEDENGPYAGAQAYSGGGGGLTSAGGSGAGSGGAPSAPTSGGVPGSKFVNFDRLMSANKDAAAKTSADVVARVGTAAQNAEQGQVGFANTYGSAVTAGQPQNQPGGVQPFQFVQGDVAAPNLVPDDPNAHGPEALAYQGPTAPYDPKYDYEQVMSDTLAAQQQVNALGSPEGYRSLFDTPGFGGGGSSGAKDFSAALSYGGTRPGAADLKARYGGLTDRLLATYKDARTQSDAAKTASDKAVSDAEIAANPPPKPNIVLPAASGELTTTSPWRQVPGGYVNTDTGEFVSDADATQR